MLDLLPDSPAFSAGATCARAPENSILDLKRLFTVRFDSSASTSASGERRMDCSGSEGERAEPASDADAPDASD